jgi:pilus assembly protein CpaF
MSLLQRVTQAKQAAEATAPVEPGTTDTPATPLGPGPTTSSAPPVSDAPRAQAGTSAATAIVPVAPPVVPPRPAYMPTPNAKREEGIRNLRLHMQEQVINAFDSILDAKPEDIQTKIEGIVDRVVKEESFAVTKDEREALVDQMVHDVTGFGPLEPLLNDESITEVMVNGPTHVYIERRGKIERIDSVFLNDEHVLRIIDRIISPMGRRIDESSPRVDARLPDGSRVNAIIEPLSLVGPVITVRKFAKRPYTVDDLIRFGTATPEMFEFLRACIRGRLNLFVSGGTGSGKTTTLNVLSSFIPNDERIVTIEDAAELQLRQEHVITLESRPPNLEGTGEITIRNLLRNSMHMRPDRIIVGECRSGEALDMLQAMTTGHDGSLSTGHANSPIDMLRRLETMVLMTGYQLPLRAIREQIASAVDLIVHTARLKDGSRKITHITEVYGIEDDDILTQDIFEFQQRDFVDGKIIGELQPTGIRPTFMPQLKKAGIELPPGEYGIPPEDPKKPVRARKSRWGGEGALAPEDIGRLGEGKAVVAGGMVYVSSIGPVDPATGQLALGGIKDHAHQCLENLKVKLESVGSSMDRIVWANWSLKDPTEFDAFNEEWAKWFPGDAPVGQGTVMGALQRRAGFRVSIGVIAEA